MSRKMSAHYQGVFAGAWSLKVLSWERNPKNRGWLIIGLGLLLLVSGLVACRPADEAAGQEQSNSDGLVIYSGRSESLVGPIIKIISDSRLNSIRSIKRLIVIRVADSA